jgi:hypothetical protein
MPYARKFNPDRYRVIQGVISKLERLQSGGRVVVSGLGREELERVRYLTYDWLSHMELKHNYRLRMDYRARELVIQHLGEPEGMRVRVDTGAVRDDLMRELIDNEEGAADLVNQWINEGKVTQSEGEELLSALAQVLS